MPTKDDSSSSSLQVLFRTITSSSFSVSLYPWLWSGFRDGFTLLVPSWFSSHIRASGKERGEDVAGCSFLGMNQNGVIYRPQSITCSSGPAIPFGIPWSSDSLLLTHSWLLHLFFRPQPANIAMRIQNEGGEEEAEAEEE